MLSGYQKYCGQNLTIYVKLNKLIIKHFLTVDLFVKLTIYLWDLCFVINHKTRTATLQPPTASDCRYLLLLTLVSPTCSVP